MIKKALVIMMSLCMTGAMVTGCQTSGSGSEGGTGMPAEQTTEVNESEQNLARIRKAYADYYASSLREKKSKRVSKGEDGVKSKIIETEIVDTERQIVYSKEKRTTSGSEYEDANKTVNVQDFYTVEDGTDYHYAYRKKADEDGNFSDDKIWYKVELPKEKGEDDYYNTYSNFAGSNTGTFLEDDEYGKYRNIVITENGHKDINGTDAVEYLGEFEYCWLDYPDTSREQLIKENEWDEAVIEKIDGMSECIDDYVEDYNKKAAEAREFHKTTMKNPIYLSAETGALLQTSTTYGGVSEDEIEKQYSIYRNKYYDYEYYTNENSLSGGMSKKEALKEVNSKDYEKDYKPVGTDKMTEKTTFYSGDACDEIPDLPKNVKEMKYDKYEEGFYDSAY